MISCLLETLVIYLISSKPGVKNIDWLTADLYFAFLVFFLVIYVILTFFINLMKNYYLKGLLLIVIIISVCYLTIHRFILQKSCLDWKDGLLGLKIED